MNALKLDFPDGAFVAAMCIAALHHFSDADATTLLGELHRVARDKIVIVDADGAGRGWIQPALIAADRGAWMRTPAALRTLVGSSLEVIEMIRYRVGLYDMVMLECRPTS